jgi:hypothetical protein
MLVSFVRLYSRSIRRLSSAATPPHSPIRGVIFDAGGVLFSSPMAGLAAALDGRSLSIKAAVARIFSASAYGCSLTLQFLITAILHNRAVQPLHGAVWSAAKYP